MRSRSSGSSSAGSSRRRNVRCGSTPRDDRGGRDLLAALRARRRSRGRRARRCAPPRRPCGSPPRSARAASASAWRGRRDHRATSVAEPAPLPPCAADCSSRFAVVPADQGPANAPKMPRAQTTARRISVSNHSAAKSATAIGIQRSRRWPSSRPRPRSREPEAEQRERVARERPVDVGRRQRAHARQHARERRRASRWNSG